MDITVVKNVPITQETFDLLRAAPLENTGDEEIFIYRNATMRLASLWPEEVNLTSLYVLQDRLDFQRELRAHLLKEYEVDTLQLSSVLTLQNGDKQFGMTPLYVEIYQETVQIIPLPGDRLPPKEVSLRVPILKDGLHRMWLAREEGIQAGCILIHGALKEYPPYAYPNSWEEVSVCEEIPKTKKFYRRQQPHTHMRPVDTLRTAADAPSITEYGRTQ